MNKALVTHVGFSDESNWNTGQFRSLGLVTAPINIVDQLEEELRRLLKDYKTYEFKWKKLKCAKERFTAIKMCNFAIDKACRNLLRIDVLVWDIRDIRHHVRGRDDIENLQRMYYHLFRNVLRKRWPKDAVWRLYPDEHTAMDWQKVEDCLKSAGRRLVGERSLFGVRLQKEFSLQEIVSVRSVNHPLLQLADLFCGMAVFSREKFDEYQGWLEANCNQLHLTGDTPDVRPSRSSKERFEVLKTFDEGCKKHCIGVSIKQKRGLWTPNPENPLNFWMYRAQHPLDRAPQRVRR